MDTHPHSQKPDALLKELESIRNDLHHSESDPAMPSSAPDIPVLTDSLDASADTQNGEDQESDLKQLREAYRSELGIDVDDSSVAEESGDDDDDLLIADDPVADAEPEPPLLDIVDHPEHDNAALDLAEAYSSEGDTLEDEHLEQIAEELDPLDTTQITEAIDDDMLLDTPIQEEAPTPRKEVQGSLFDSPSHPPAPAAGSPLSSTLNAKGENPFLPPHIRNQLGKHKGVNSELQKLSETTLAQSTLFRDRTSQRLNATRVNTGALLSEDEIHQLIDQTIEEYLPKIEYSLRLKLQKKFTDKI